MKASIHKLSYCILVFTTCVFHSVLAQKATLVEIPRLNEGNVSMREAMLNPKLNIGIFELHYFKDRASHSYYVVIDYNKKEIVSTFQVKGWTYLYSSWIQNDSLFYLSRGTFPSRKFIFNLKTGEKIQTKLKNRCHAPETENGQGVHFGHEDFYCTKDIVYWEDLRMYFNEKKHALIIEEE